MVGFSDSISDVCSSDLLLRIELVRARAALERQRLLRSGNNLAASLTPSALVKGLLPQSVARQGASDWMFDAVGLLRRYPLLASGAPTLLSGAGRSEERRVGTGCVRSGRSRGFQF